MVNIRFQTSKIKITLNSYIVKYLLRKWRLWISLLSTREQIKAIKELQTTTPYSPLSYCHEREIEY